MSAPRQTVTIRQFAAVALLTVALLALGELVARAATGEPAAGAAITYVLVTPALCLFAFRRRGEPMGAWLAFWTCSFAVYLACVVGATIEPAAGDVTRGFGFPHAVSHPYNDAALAAVWGLDLLLAWLAVWSEGDVWSSPRGIRAFRGLVHVWVFGTLVAIWLTEPVPWYVRALGALMTLLVACCAAARVVLKPFDSDSLVGRLYVTAFDLVNVFVPWHRLPTWLAVMNLGAYRETLRAKNLHDTKGIPVTNPDNLTAAPPFDPAYLLAREDDGYYDDLATATMGAASTNTNPVAPAGSGARATHDSMYFNRSQPGARFGRNVPLDKAFPDEDRLLVPNPRLVSKELLARDTFKPAKILNLLAAAWIQFETHDWFNHGEPPWEGEREDKVRRGERDPITAEQYRAREVPLPKGDDWPEDPMRVRPTRPDPTRDYEKERRENKGTLKYPPTYANAESHWWDGSQIYGSNRETTERLRWDYEKDSNGKLARDTDGHLIPTTKLADGKLFVGSEGLSLDPSTGTALSGFTGNWWLGLSLLHTLFTREHNAICDAVRREYPYWDGDDVFRVARLVNSALIAKIHTVEWTPAILTHPALQVAMSANWWGLLTERLKKALGRVSRNEAFSGIPGSGVDHGAADYALTEEFVSVYRLHPLMPDKFEVLSARDGRFLREYVLPDGVVGDEAVLTALGHGASMGDLFYSFGVANPGAVTLHNYPNFLRRLTRPEQFGVAETVDLATVDILRDRERGVPRYNEFRRLLHCKPIASFDDFKNPDFPTLGADLRRIYGQTDGRDNVELLDLMVGMYAEVPPAGFGFSDTAFRVFILMASRRLKSDRFIAGDAFVPEVYTQVGLDWLEKTTMTEILLRHYPELGPSLYGVGNAFAPWNPVGKNPVV